jgi:hypothetical protein
MRLIQPADEARWFLYSEDPDKPPDKRERVEFKIRRLPSGKAKEIDVRIHGRTRKTYFRKGSQVIEYDVEKLDAAEAEKAAYVLMDSRNADLPASDVPSLASQAIDGWIRLDGRWTPDVAREAFSAVPGLATWLLKRAHTLEAAMLEDEEGKGGS